jgi:uncharacterized protein (TIGR02145 family)
MAADKANTPQNIADECGVTQEDIWNLVANGSSFGTCDSEQLVQYLGNSLSEIEQTCGAEIPKLSSSSNGNSLSSNNSSSSGGSSSSGSSSSSKLPTGCTAADNNDTHYCSKGTIKEYGSVTDKDGNTYKTVIIGTQTWMAENLNLSTNREGYAIGKCYNDVASNCDKCGRLYDYVMAYDNVFDGSRKGVCPEDLHLPSHEEWETLKSYVGYGTRLKSIEWIDPDGLSFDDGTDDYGFSALPCGKYYYVGTTGSDYYFTGKDKSTSFWSAEYYSSSYYIAPWSTHLASGMNISIIKEVSLKNWYSVRCVKD